MESSTDEPPKDHEAFPDGRCRLILIGKTGVGKSATGNTILGDQVFKSQIGLNSETSQCGCEETMINGLKVSVMDTPGLADTEGRDEEFAIMITRSLCAVDPGPHAILLCVKCNGRFTDAEHKVIQGLKEIFGQKMTDYLILIFTGKDDLDSDAVDNFEKTLKKSVKLDGLLNECERRYLLFDNRTDDATEKEEQVNKLLLKVKEVVTQNGGKCFRHKESKEISETMKVMMKEELRERKKGAKPVIPRKTPVIPMEKPVIASEAGFTMTPTEDSVDPEKPVTPTRKEVALSEIPATAESGDGNESTSPVEEEKVAHTATSLSEVEASTEPEAALTAENQTQVPDQDVEEEKSEAREPVYAVVKRNEAFESEPVDETHHREGKGDEDKDNECDLSHADMQAQRRRESIDELRKVGVVKDRLKRFAFEEDHPAETKLSRQLSEPSKSASTKKPVARSNTVPRGLTSMLAPETTGDGDASSVTESMKDLYVTTDPEKWLEEDEELNELLSDIPSNPGMTMEQKKQMVEDALRRKIATAPLEELTEAQRERLEASAKSIGQKIKKAMKSFANAIDQCRLM